MRQRRPNEQILVSAVWCGGAAYTMTMGALISYVIDQDIQRVGDIIFWIWIVWISIWFLVAMWIQTGQD